MVTMIAIACSFASCKKDRSCTCTYSNSGSSDTYTEITTYNKVSKKLAKTDCTSGTVYSQAHPGNIQTRVCDLK